YAVDGSQMKYDGDAGALYLPDGSRYLFGTSFGDVVFVDRNGNMLSYNAASKQWTDTMGRTIALPPLINTSPRSRSYTLPGFGSTTRTITFHWRNLSDVLPDPSQPLRYRGDKSCPGYPETTISPSLFTSLPVSDSVCGGGIFNPVVLWKITFPGATSFYTFSYNVYGEIDKIVLPTGGYQRFRHNAVDGISSRIQSGKIY